MLLQDYRSGAIGRVRLETPESRVALLASYKQPLSLGEAAEAVDEDEADDVR